MASRASRVGAAPADIRGPRPAMKRQRLNGSDVDTTTGEGVVSVVVLVSMSERRSVRWC
jgi:hypothetical protein